MAKTKRSAVRKVIVANPDTKTERKLDAAIYHPFKSAIIQSLKKKSGKTYTEVADEVIKTIDKKMPGFKGSIPWYTIIILRDLHAKGVVESVMGNGKKLNRLIR
jgi:hypothetical protein